MESAEMISPPIRSASKSAISDFPTAVGPAMKTGVETGLTGFTGLKNYRQHGFAVFHPVNPINPVKKSVLFWRRAAARQNRRKRKTCDEYRHADPLRGREAEVVMEIGVIAAKIFNERAR